MSKRSAPSSTPGRSGSSNQMLANAVMALRMQKPQEAERLASEVLNSDGDDIAAAGILGRALLIQNRAAEAEIETLLALALSATGRGEAALDQLRKAAARRPAYPPAFLEQAGLFARK